MSVDLDIDVGTLLASSYNALDTKSLKSQSEEYLKNLTRDNLQLLINKIWELPVERVDDVIVATLPEPEYILPRSQGIPKPKPLTKWQQFAKEKGIQSKKKKKPKLQWDELLKKWIPTYGYKRAKAQEQQEWLVEVKDSDDPNNDPFAKTKEAKLERQSKNELQRLRNIAKAKNIKLPKVGLPTKEHFPNSQQLSEAATVAHKSTASLGKFQPEIKQPTTSGKRKKTNKVQKGNMAKKPKAGKGERNLHKKVGGRKRR